MTGLVAAGIIAGNGECRWTAVTSMTLAGFPHTLTDQFRTGTWYRLVAGYATGCRSIFKPFRCLLPILAALVFTQQAIALDPSRALTQYVQSAWRMEQGLPHNTVRAIVQTRDGYIWLGTYAGLARFDGVRFVVYNDRNSGLLHNEIRSLVEDHDGVLWVGTTAGGLHRLVDGSLKPFDRDISHRTINAA